MLQATIPRRVGVEGQVSDRRLAGEVGAPGLSNARVCQAVAVKNPQHAGEGSQPLGLEVPVLGVLMCVEVHEVVEAVAARATGLQELGVDQPLRRCVVGSS